MIVVVTADLVPHCGKHERCPPILIALVHAKHHDQVADDSRALAYGHSHVQGVRVVHGAGEGRREEWRAVNYQMGAAFLTFQECVYWGFVEWGLYRAPL